jgi:hypothetical protein
MGPEETILGPEQFALRDGVSPLQDGGQFVAHRPYPGDSVGDEERKRYLGRSGYPIAHVGVDVHIPQAGDEILSGSVDDQRAPRSG